jgi:hypothetical protein
MSEATQLIILFASTAALFFGSIAAVMMNRRNRTTGPGSARFLTASAATNLRQKLKPVVRKGDEILMPAGRGRYPSTLVDKARSDWERQIEAWTNDGIVFKVIITTPNDQAEHYWQTLADRLSPNFKVLILDRTAASVEDAADIDRLGTFHPVLAVRGSEPLGMWIESMHEDDSPVAYNIEYLAAPDIIDYQRARFFQLLSMLRRLTDEDRNPPHLRRLLPSSTQGAVNSVIDRAA